MHFHDIATLPLVSRALVVAGWVWFFAAFVLRRPPRGEPGAKRDRSSRTGILLQMVGFALVWVIQRPLPPSTRPLAKVEIALDLLAPLLTIVSMWIGLWAVRTLGRQWSYEARLIEGHQLVTRGPYAWVRHPIYTAMLGKLLASNFAFGDWLGLAVAGTLFVIGTSIRIRSEERLLRDAFGPEYEAYARRVPGFIPGLF
jgi:protein-S-isoprenylcysteine O-methyltransferase Ste14